MNSYCLVFAVIITTFLQNGFCDSQLSFKIDSNLLLSLETGENANILLHMQESTAPLLKNLKQRKFTSRSDRLNTVTQELKAQSEISQKSVVHFLKANSISYKSFWISNRVYIPEADLSLVEKLSELPQVSKISLEIKIRLNLPPKIDSDENSSISPDNIQWGVQKIQADAAWGRKVTGEGVVVGVIDTGVRATHNDLRNNFRQDHGWYDATNNSQTPYDDNGHGTHCTGTIVGANGIGVAPGAKWIHCKAFNSNGEFLENDLYECGEFMLCPHLPNGAYPNCSMAPHLVSNSWGYPGIITFYDVVADAWVAAGIIPFFAIGNEGPKCRTLGSPGYQTNVIAVGATTNNDSLAAFSSRGGTWTNDIFKPDISAPGSEITSASHTNDTGYALMDGTSMACPHAAGVGALLLSMKKDMSFEEMKTILFSTADTEGLIEPPTFCGSDTGSLYPNNAFGHGRINAYKAVMTLSSGNVVSRSLLIFWGALGGTFFHIFHF